jgi:hypothetical protein
MWFRFGWIGQDGQLDIRMERFPFVKMVGQMEQNELFLKKTLIGAGHICCGAQGISAPLLTAQPALTRPLGFDKLNRRDMTSSTGAVCVDKLFLEKWQFRNAEPQRLRTPQSSGKS